MHQPLRDIARVCNAAYTTSHTCVDLALEILYAGTLQWQVESCGQALIFATVHGVHGGMLGDTLGSFKVERCDKSKSGTTDAVGTVKHACSLNHPRVESRMLSLGLDFT